VGQFDQTDPLPNPAITQLGSGSPYARVLGAGSFSPGGPVDLVVFDSVSRLQVLQNDGHAGFTLGNLYLTDYPIGGVIFGSPIIADFNGDHNLDIAVGDSGVVSILLGNDNQTFQGIAPFGNGGTSIVAGDFNNDGKPDLAALNESGQNGAVDAFLGNGDGTFSSDGSYQLAQSPAFGASDLAVGDFNGDGNLDLVASSGDIELLLGNGDGTFQSPVTISSINGAWLAAADFNGDGKQDLAATNGSNVDIFLGNGNGTFQAPVSYFVGTSPGPLTVGDVDGDGKLDIVATTCYQSACNTPQLGILLGKGDGTFQSAVFMNVGQSGDPLGSAGIGDFNGDGIPDLAVPDLKSPATVQIFLETGGGKFASPIDYPYSGANVVVADFNGDGSTHLGGTDQGHLAVVLGNGAGAFGPQQVFTSLFVTTSMAVADFNLDGKPDVALAGRQTGNYQAVLLNTTAAGFTVSAMPLSPATVVAGSSASSTISVTPTFGFNGSVTLSCSGLPTGANCSFNPATLTNASGKSALTVTTSSTLAAGKYPFTVNGVSGSVESGTGLTLLVQTPPGFTVTATALTLASITAGGSASSTVTAASAGGFNQVVTLSCSSILLNGSAATVSPPTCTFNPSSIAGASGNSTLTVSTTASSASMAPAATRFSGPFYAILLPIVGLGLMGARFDTGKRKWLGVVLACLMISSLILLAACSESSGHGGTDGGGSGGGTPAGTYTITVSGSAGSAGHSTTVTLTVQ
jgi:hypothetical protein